MTTNDALAAFELRPVRVSDAAALASAYRRNEEHLRRWEPLRSEVFFTEVGQQDELDRQQDAVDRGLVDAWLLLDGDDVVARLNLNNLVRGVLQSASIGYWVDRERTGRGIAGALVGFAQHRAGVLGLHRLEAGTLVDNAASQRVLERAGFERYGLAPRMLFIAGEWQDQVLFQRILHDEPAGPAVP